MTAAVVPVVVVALVGGIAAGCSVVETVLVAQALWQSWQERRAYRRR